MRIVGEKRGRGRVPKKKELLAAMEAAGVKKKGENTTWGKTIIVHDRKASRNDFVTANSCSPNWSC
ncbi:hypothetical protein TIFTF001_046995 [Ficus carica]|uniref:Uncharacterized protein n=1 Tax=Ficus carica TaxID=3494 RepID=A0AA87YVL7_FICCA|nr:hypothetical protein TIFTF001_046995 [Ficus carica]